MNAGPIILFDGMCVLCSRGARFVLRRDRRARFRLAAIQSQAGATLCRRFGVDALDPGTMLLIENGRALGMSDAVLVICRGLGWPWRILGLFRLVPRPLRDALCRLVAHNRYRWFGRRQTCWLPDEAARARVL